MKPFQFYVVKRMRELAVGDSLTNQVQFTLSGENEDIRTTITMEAGGFENGLSLLRVKSAIRHNTIGYVKKVIDQERRRIDFIEYLQPVDFEAYWDEGRGLMLFQAPKRTCRGVLSHLKANPCGIELAEMEVDFTKVMQLNEEYLGAWFRGVSARVHSAGLTGDQIQDDKLFKSLSKVAALSNVTVPWLYEGVEHPVMLTSRAGVVLVRNYNDLGLELSLVMDVQENLLRHVWHERDAKGEAELAPQD